MSRRVEVGGYEVVQAPHLRRRAGVLVEDYVREEAIDISPDLCHEMPADLVRVVAQATWMLLVTREQQEPYVLEGVATQDHRTRLLHSTAPVGIQVLDAAGVPTRVGEDADDPAVGSQVEIAGRKRLWDRGQAGMPPLVVERTKTPAPGAVGGRRVPVVGLAVHGDRRRVGM